MFATALASSCVLLQVNLASYELLSVACSDTSEAIKIPNSKLIAVLPMFKKPLAQQSNATPIRSSARRQLISAIFAQYPDLLTGKDEVEEKSLAKVIVPEGIRLGSFETSGGVEGVRT